MENTTQQSIAKPSLIQRLRNPLVALAVGILILFIASIILRYLTIKARYIVVSTDFDPTTQKASIFQRVGFTFNKSISDEFFNTCKITSQPDPQFQLNKNDRILSVVPRLRLENDTLYRFTITCQEFTTDFAYNTQSPGEMTEEEVNQLQTLRDYQFSKELENVYTEKPWLEQFPIIEKHYDLGYKQDENRFYALAKIPAGSGLTKLQIEQEIKAKLIEIQAPELEIVWR